MNTTIEDLDDTWFKHVSKELEENVLGILVRHALDPVIDYRCFRGVWDE